MPKLLELLRQEPDFPRVRMLFMLSVSGLAGVALLVTINLAAAQIAVGQLEPRQFLIALTLLVLTVYAQHHSLGLANLAAEEILLKLRLRTGDLLRRADLNLIESELDTSDYAALTNDSQIVSQSALSLALLARSTVVVLASLLYLGWISLASMLVTLAFIGTYGFIHQAFIHPQLAEQLQQGQVFEKGVIKSLQTLLGNFKQTKLSRVQNDGLFEDYGRAAFAASECRRQVNTEISNSFSLGYSSFYLLLIVLVMLVPTLDTGLSAQVFKITTTVIFILSELDPWLTWIPEIVRADAALEDLTRLEKKLLSASGRARQSP